MSKGRGNRSSRAFVVNKAADVDPFVMRGGGICRSNEYWGWGSDNLFPLALAYMYRHSTAHRRVINDKADYISGRGFSFDENNKTLARLTEQANGQGESLRSVLNKLAIDKALFGNAFLEVVTNRAHSFVSFFHQDASRCRLAHERQHIILNHDWRNYSPAKARRLPLFPAFEQTQDGFLRSIIHYKDYEPMFQNYGVPAYVAGRNVSAIAYKTDRWNISRLDNSFQLSGVMILDSSVDSEEDAVQIVDAAKRQFAGKPGQVMFLVKSNSTDAENTKFIPIDSSNEGDWKDLHSQATADIIVAHSWFRALSGLDYSTGFNAERVLHEYQIALNTVIQPEQQEIMEPICQAIDLVTGIETSSLQIINRPPITQKPNYMRVWEARKADGLDYDETDPMQQRFLAEIVKEAKKEKE